MSSDDYIFVLASPVECLCGSAGIESADHKDECPVSQGDKEYRVKYVLGAYWENEDEMLEEFSKGDVPIYYDHSKALVAAHDLHQKESEVYPVEYGVQVIFSKNPVPREVTNMSEAEQEGQAGQEGAEGQEGADEGAEGGNEGGEES